MTSILKKHRSITITPIGKKGSENESRKDYDFQTLIHEDGKNKIWDDASNNSSKVGDLFGFVHNAGGNRDIAIVEIHKIVAILDQANRHPDWKNEKHTGRQVLVLSDKIDEIMWTDLYAHRGKECRGSHSHLTSPLMGTQRWDL